ncbi:MAG: M15 family metallopeptidase [Eubacteriales bacterium]
MGKAVTYVPRFQSNLGYISHHTLGTAIDVNDDMYPNKNKSSNHDIIGDDVKNHLVYNGIQTDETGVRYYDFTYDGSYPARYLKVPKTIVNYLLYELAFFRAGFEWGYYYETTCDAMHFMLTENDINRHMHSDIGLRKVYAYIEPEWIYVPTPAPTPDDGPTPAPAPDDEPTPAPAPDDEPTPTPAPEG